MKKVSLNKKVPAFKAETNKRKTLRLSSFKGQNVILFFYPKDSTPGCTTEALDFTAQLTKFKRANAVVLGVSRDSIASHEKFVEKQSLKVELISDPDEELCEVFDVMKMKNLYGRKFRGIERSTFLIDEKGVLRHEWRKVKVKGHVDEVLQILKDWNSKED